MVHRDSTHSASRLTGGPLPHTTRTAGCATAAAVQLSSRHCDSTVAVATRQDVNYAGQYFECVAKCPTVYARVETVFQTNFSSTHNEAAVNAQHVKLAAQLNAHFAALWHSDCAGTYVYTFTLVAPIRHRCFLTRKPHCGPTVLADRMPRYSQRLQMNVQCCTDGITQAPSTVHDDGLVLMAVKPVIKGNLCFTICTMLDSVQWIAHYNTFRVACIS